MAPSMIPVPDPTIVTGERIDAAVESLREIVEAELHGVTQEVKAQGKVFRTRLAAYDEAIKLLTAQRALVPKDTDAKIKNLKEFVGQQLKLHVEKFKSVALQFKERDTRSERESRDNKTAVDAAFSAQKEAAAKQDEANSKAIDKSEKAMTEKVDKLAELFKTTTDGLRDQIADLKDRLTRSETALATKADSQIERRGVSGNVAVWVFGAVMALLGIFGLFSGLVHK